LVQASRQEGKKIRISQRITAKDQCKRVSLYQSLPDKRPFRISDNKQWQTVFGRKFEALDPCKAVKSTRAKYGLEVGVLTLNEMNFSGKKQIGPVA
jgi:hypothetical protein